MAKKVPGVPIGAEIVRRQDVARADSFPFAAVAECWSDRRRIWLLEKADRLSSDAFPTILNLPPVERLTHEALSQ